MKIIDKFAAKAKNLEGAEIPTIAFIGDSVTQGCFEIYLTGEETLETVFDAENGYHAKIKSIFNMLYPGCPLNIINAGVSGDKSWSGYERLERDVLRYNPDLVVVAFGLNDAATGEGKFIERYKESLANIFTAIKEAGSEAIFLTTNMMNTYVPYKVKEELFRLIAEACMKCELSGDLERFFKAGIEVAKEHGVPVCDVYSKWSKFYENGVDVTMLLANDVNHPTRDMHWFFAHSLVDTMFDD